MSATVQPVIEKRNPPTGVWWRWAVVLAPGVLLYFFALPGMNTAQERLFAIFTATIIALVAQPVRMGVSVLLAMTLLALTGTLTPARVLAGVPSRNPWDGTLPETRHRPPLSEHLGRMGPIRILLSE